MYNYLIPESILSQLHHIAEVCAQHKPLVQISCITYNQESFLRAALDGFLMQKTEFSFVVIVHDDASTDGTIQILKEYAERYPDIIFPIYEEENQYSNPESIAGYVMNTARKNVNAKYIALCEGDDYWSDSYKLQKQVDFLESNPEYSMCFHNAIEHWEDGRKLDHPFANLENRDYNYREICSQWIVPTASAVLKRRVFESQLYKTAISCKNFIYGDILIWLTAVEFGKIYCMNDYMSVYRRHIGSATYEQTSDEKIKKIIKHTQTIPKIFGEKYKFFARNITVKLSIDKCIEKFRSKNVREFFYFFVLSLKYAPVETVKSQMNIIYKYIKSKFMNRL